VQIYGLEECLRNAVDVRHMTQAEADSKKAELLSDPPEFMRFIMGEARRLQIGPCPSLISET